ncbi:alpha/beta hydrolase [Noviherbaspirillum sp.]|uniref:RBBP9/YdeN family alpha/beta hydrolase n=1 Tax=Noviherbaspirillum sp. TaxID=1926288 RepID=UPI002D670D41|nr:alpha/beta hydrolase [Noviherbaspirillum sp.]HZW22958.1 alpha/beta hydrolase [Noviherbaspirillum sp.]
MTTTILIHPGLFNSGEGHWQTLWEADLPGAHRVQQRDWEQPVRSEWVDTLDAAIRNAPGPVVLAAHSLGCATAAWWAVTHGAAPHAAKLKGALLVAPPDVERSDFPAFVTGFTPMPQIRLPFKAVVVASSNDPWCEQPKAKAWAEAWGAHFHDLGPRGHINAESGLGDWGQGRNWLYSLAS